MTLIAVSQRVAKTTHGERQDCLDQQWSVFLHSLGLTALIIPNHTPTARALLENHVPHGVLLTGGNDLAAYGGDAPERDAIENVLIDYAIDRNAPLMGICRGMQMIAHRFGGTLTKVEGHVNTRHAVVFSAGERSVNSYHDYAVSELSDDLEAIARTRDGMIEAVRHRKLDVTGIMWHPERNEPFDTADAELFRSTYHVKAPI